MTKSRCFYDQFSFATSGNSFHDCSLKERKCSGSGLQQAFTAVAASPRLAFRSAWDVLVRILLVYPSNKNDSEVTRDVL